MKKVLVLPKYSRKAASTRYRIEQFLPLISGSDYKFDVFPLLNDEYLSNRNGKFFQLLNISDAYIRRIQILQKSNEYDFIWTNYELFPYLPYFFESKFLRKIKIWLDFDDATFHQYDLHKNLLVRVILASKIRNIIRDADVITVGNEYLATYARAVSQKVFVLPTVVDCEKYIPIKKQNQKIRIGWIGSPSTTKYLKLVERVLEELQKEKNIEIVLVGASDQKFSFFANRIEWKENQEIAEVQKFDIGIMPLADSSWERGKCGFKLIQYMSCGVPVVASPIGANVNIVEGVGYIADSSESWLKALGTLVDSELLRREMGEKSREKIVREYSLKKWAPEFKRILLSI